MSEMNIMFEINAEMYNGKTVPFGYTYTQEAASASAQRFRERYCYGEPRKEFDVKDFTVRQVRVEMKVTA